jgi:hypothetical protein
MVSAIKQTVTVGPGGLIQVRSPQLQAGTRAEVIVLVEIVRDQPTTPAAPLASFVGAGKGVFSSIQEIDAFIRDGRAANR